MFVPNFDEYQERPQLDKLPVGEQVLTIVNITEFDKPTMSGLDLELKLDDKHFTYKLPMYTHTDGSRRLS